LVIVALPSLAEAATILSSPAEFSTPNLLIGFEALPDGSPIEYGDPILSNQWQSRGFLISDSSPANGASASSGTFGVPAHSGTHAISDSDRFTNGGFIEFHFVYPVSGAPGTVQEAGLWVQNGDLGSTVSFFDAAGNLLQAINTTSQDFFAGIRASEGIARIRVDDPDIYLVDDLQFTPVPEPLAGSLATAFLMLAAWLRGEGCMGGGHGVS
jgi:hypothetical protein